jgi:hypothetical protein
MEPPLEKSQEKKSLLDNAIVHVIEVSDAGKERERKAKRRKEIIEYSNY